MKEIRSIAEAESWGAEHGVMLTPQDRDRLAKLMVAERARLIETTPDRESSWADRWNAFYPRLLETITSAGETLLTFAQTVIVSLGVPTVLVLLLIVEHQRVLHGIQLFETDYALASFAAWALVLLNLVLEFQVHYIEHSAGYREELAKRGSLRLWLRGLAYWLGMGDGWRPQDQSPAHRYKSLLRLVTFAILSLALVGSMRSVIEPLGGAWYTALWQIVTQSSLLLILTWLGGLLFTAAAVLAAQGLSRYVAIRTVQIVADMQQRQTIVIDPFAAEIDAAAARAAHALLAEKVERRRAKEAARHNADDAPFGVTAPEQAAHAYQMTYAANGNSNGNGNGSHSNGNHNGKGIDN